MVLLKLFQDRPLLLWQQNLGHFNAESARRAHRAVVFAIAELSCLCKVCALFILRDVRGLFIRALIS